MADDDLSDVVGGLVQEADRMLAALTSLCKRVNTDITIQCGKETFLCHSELLRARSTVFFKMLEGGERCQVLQIDDVKPSVMEAVIKYIYTGQVSISGDRIVDLITGSKKFELPGLLSKCLENFRDQNQFDHAVDILVFAEKHSLKDFKKVAVHKIISNRTVLLADQSFRDKLILHPGLLLQLFENLCQAFDKAGSESVNDEGTKTVKQLTIDSKFVQKKKKKEKAVKESDNKESPEKEEFDKSVKKKGKKAVAVSDINESPGREKFYKNASMRKRKKAVVESLNDKREPSGKKEKVKKRILIKDATELFKENEDW